jgi:hypothetical protein
MSSLLTALPGLGCALMMGGMMFLMARGNRQSGPPAPHDSGRDTEIADLRAEVDRLRSQVRDRDQAPESTG